MRAPPKSPDEAEHPFAINEWAFPLTIITIVHKVISRVACCAQLDNLLKHIAFTALQRATMDNRLCTKHHIGDSPEAIVGYQATCGARAAPTVDPSGPKGIAFAACFSSMPLLSAAILPAPIPTRHFAHGLSAAAPKTAAAPDTPNSPTNVPEERAPVPGVRHRLCAD